MAAKGPATLTDPRSICDRYSDATYAKMRDDQERTSAYTSAIEVMAPGRVCLDIGTGSLALLALIAARSGAKHVYAIEANPAAAAAAREAVLAAGMEEVVTIVEGYSTDVTLPEPVDLLLHEILGEFAGAEGVVRAVRDAAARHLSPSATPPLSVPHGARSLIAPAEFPSPEYFSSLPFPMLSAPGATNLKLPSLPRAVLLAEAATFEDLAFDHASPQPLQQVRLEFVPARDGEMRGLAVHIEVDVLGRRQTMARGEDNGATTVARASAPAERREHGHASDTTSASHADVDAPPRPPPPGAADPDVSSARPGSHWPNVLLLLPEALQVTAGVGRIIVDCRASLGAEVPRYTFEVRIALEGENDDGALLGTLTYPE
jgi:SAM-dependent methyltransferase